MNKSTKLLKNTIVIGISKVITATIGFALLPIMTSGMSTGEYGFLDLVISYVTLFTPVILLGLDIGAFRFIIESREDYVRKQKIISTIFITTTSTAAAGVILFAAFNVFFKLNLSWWIIAYILSAIFYLLAQQIIRGEGDNKGFAFSSIIFSIILALGITISLKFFNFGLSGVFISYIVSSLISIIFCFRRVKIHKYLNIRHYDKKIQKELLAFSLPIIPNGISWYIFHASDRTIISFILGTAANGVYAVANKFAGIVGVIENVLYVSWAEAASSHIDHPDRDVFFSKTLNTELKLLFSLSILILPMISILFPILVNENFFESYLYIPVLIFSVILCFITSFYSAIYLAKKMTKQVMITSIVGALVNLFINIVLVWFIGVWAAAMSTAISYAIMAVHRHFDIKKFVKIKFEKWLLLKITTCFIVISTIYYINIFWLSILSIIASVFIALIMNRNIINNGLKYIKTASN